MKRRFTLLIVMISLSFSSITAQTTLSIGEFDPYLSEYFRPFARGIASGMGAGWAHTAEVHSTLGFDVTINLTIVNIPASAAGFSSSDIASMQNDGYTFSGNEFPNIRSDGGPTTFINKNFDPIAGIGVLPAINFEALQGLNLGFAGSASLQAAVGLPKGTELMIRFMPDISGVANTALSALGDTKLLPTMIWGLGVKHDIKQWIPVISKIPFLQVSGLLSYSKFTTGIKSGDLLITPENFGSPETVHDFSGANYSDQQFEMDVSSLTGSLLIGASIPVFQPFVGIGFNRGKFDAGLTGTYPILELNEGLRTDGANLPTPFIVSENGTEKDPLIVDDIKTQLNLQAGARIKLGFIVFHYQFTKQEYTDFLQIIEC